jgi:hypothetical protein
MTVHSSFRGTVVCLYFAVIIEGLSSVAMCVILLSHFTHLSLLYPIT